MKRFLLALFNFLSSLKLAVITLVTLAIVLGWATFVESMYDTETAQHYFYRSPFFAVLLIVLGINVLAAALSRYPWKPRHYGFVVTHAGIITILVGAMMTVNMGVEGTMALDTGEGGSAFNLKQTVITLYSPKLNETAQWPAEFRFTPPTPDKPVHLSLPNGPQLAILDYYNNASRHNAYAAGGADDPPALHFALNNDRVNVHVDNWLGSDSEDKREINFGPASFRLEAARTPEDLKRLLAPPPNTAYMGEVELFFPQAHAVFPVGAGLDKTLDVPGTAYKIHIQRYLPDASVSPDKKQLITKSQEPNNPAVEFELITAAGAERHTVLARMPDLPTLHGDTDRHTGVKPEFHFDPKKAAEPTVGNKMLFIAGPGGKLYYNQHSRSSDEWKSGELPLGKPFDTGWMMGLQMTVQDFLPHATNEGKLVPVRVPPGKDGPPSAIHLMVANGGETHDLWMQRGEAYNVMVGGENLEVGYRNQAQPLGFSLKLVKFTEGKDPGTDNAASYNSDVLLSDGTRGVADKPVNICMNEPLHYGGYTFFQSSFQEVNGVPRISVFSVAKDPGVPVKYAGAILMCVGIAMMFWLRGWYTNLGRKPRTSKAATAPVGNGKSRNGHAAVADATPAEAAESEEALAAGGRPRRK